MGRCGIFNPTMPWSWSVSDYHNQGADKVKSDNNNCTTNDTKFQPAEGFENDPIEDEEGEFDEDVRNITEPR